MDNIKSSN